MATKSSNSKDQSLNVFSNFDNRSVKSSTHLQTFSYKRLIKHILHNAGIKVKHKLDNPVMCLTQNEAQANKLKAKMKQAA